MRPGRWSPRFDGNTAGRWWRSMSPRGFVPCGPVVGRKTQPSWSRSTGDRSLHRAPSLPVTSCSPVTSGAMSETQPSPFTDLVSRLLDGQVSTGQVAVSPDGAQVAFTTSRVDLEGNTYRRQIWLASIDGTIAPRPLT